jgi:hypothetical protein
MDIKKMIAELREEREQVEEAILTLERLARSRGRPPSWLKEVAGSHLNMAHGDSPMVACIVMTGEALAVRQEAKSSLRSPFRLGSRPLVSPISEYSRRPAAAV